MSLHPDIIDAMVAAGASAGMDPGAVLAMVQAACRAAWNVAQQATTPPPVAPAPRETPRDIAEEMRGIAAAMHALDGEVQPNTQGSKPTGIGEQAADRVLGAVNDRPCSPAFSVTGVTGVTPSRNAMTGAERQKRYRDKQKTTVTASVTRNAPLSLSKNDLFNSKKREREATVTPLRTVTPAAVVPMSPAWQPNEKAAQLAKETLGDIGAANCLAKFRDHYEATGAGFTPSGWQAKFRKWVRSERGFTGGDQHALPLMAARDGPSHLWKFERAYQETMARRRESG